MTDIMSRLTEADVPETTAGPNPWQTPINALADSFDEAKGRSTKAYSVKFADEKEVTTARSQIGRACETLTPRRSPRVLRMTDGVKDPNGLEIKVWLTDFVARGKASPKAKAKADK